MKFTPLDAILAEKNLYQIAIASQAKIGLRWDKARDFPRRPRARGAPSDNDLLIIAGAP